jgi:hypothetical protein
MSFWRYQALRLAVAFCLFVVTVPIAFLVVGSLAGDKPDGAATAVFWLVGLVWLFGNVFGSHLITEKLSKRWSKQ